MFKKQTKILCTISDRMCDVEFLKQLHEAGMSGVRLNTAHQSFDDSKKVVENARKVSDKLPILVDTKGPEIRTLAFKKGADGEQEYIKALKAGDVVVIEGDSTKTKESTREVVYLSYGDIAKDVPVGKQILVDDGELCMTVTEKKGNQLVCRVENSGPIKGRKSVNIPGVAIALPSLSEKDEGYIKFAAEMKLDYVAHSFVRNKSDVLEIRKRLDALGSKAQIIAKIENQEGVDNIDEILEVADGVMIARGDMGIEIPAQNVPAVQKMLTRKCREQRKVVITATQMLHTMIENPRPTRAEVSDIANAVYDGTDSLMLSGESAYGKYPLEAVTIMAKIAAETEQHKAAFLDIDNDPAKVDVPHVLTRQAVKACQKLPIKAIIADTVTGRTARYLAAYRGAAPIYVAAYDGMTMRQIGLSYGVRAELGIKKGDHGSFAKATLDRLVKEGELKAADLVAVIGGNFGEATGATFMEIATVADLQKKYK
jgi:pyruvate kinase